MIKITAYLRTEEDLKKWKALPNKAEWLHKCLNTGTGIDALKAVQRRARSVDHLVEQDFVNEIDDAVTAAVKRIQINDIINKSIEDAKESIAADLVKQLPSVDDLMDKFGLQPTFDQTTAEQANSMYKGLNRKQIYINHEYIDAAQTHAQAKIQRNDLAATDPDTSPDPHKSARNALYPELKKDVFND